MLMDLNDNDDDGDSDEIVEDANDDWMRSMF